MTLGYLPLFLIGLAGASWAGAETVNVEHRGAVDLTPFVCQDITRSSLVNRVCYDTPNQTMIVQLNSVYSQYCDVPEATRDSFLNAPSMGQYYIANIKGSGICHLAAKRLKVAADRIANDLAQAMGHMPFQAPLGTEPR